MTAKHFGSSTTIRHTFQVSHEGKTYDVVIWIDEKGKFADEEVYVYLNGYQLLEDGAVKEDITDYLAMVWDSLVK